MKERRLDTEEDGNVDISSGSDSGDAIPERTALPLPLRSPLLLPLPPSILLPLPSRGLAIKIHYVQSARDAWLLLLWLLLTFLLFNFFKLLLYNRYFFN